MPITNSIIQEIKKEFDEQLMFIMKEELEKTDNLIIYGDKTIREDIGIINLNVNNKIV